MTTQITTTTAASDTTREQAGQIVAELAERLADPDRVAATATVPDNLDYVSGMPAPQSPWTALSLAEGHAGVALLYAELSHASPEHRATTHAYLAAAARKLSTQDAEEGLFGGIPSLAFAACLSQHEPNDYLTLLDRLDDYLTLHLRERLGQEAERLNAGRAGVSMDAYDTINGVSGLGRYLLLRQPRHRDLLADTLSYLVRLTQPVEAHGHTVPGWWVPTWPVIDAGPNSGRGHFGLGAAHGICGPLVLLALGWQAGIQVPGQEESIARIVDHLLAFQLDDGRWPDVISFDEFVSGSWAPPAGGRTAGWCYGTSGVARALYLAGGALDRRDWQLTAVRALGDVLTLQPLRIADCSLCHGWAGVLQTTWRLAHDSADERLIQRLPALARPILAAYDADLPFGFYYERPHLPPDQRLAPHRAGFLDGAAGIALALHTYATDREPARNWDAALLLS